MSNELVPVRNLDDIERLGGAMVKSGFFRDSRDASQAVVKILAGQELGLPPVAAMRGLHVVEGKIELSGTTVGALIKRSGRYDYRVVEHTDEKCRIEFLQKTSNIAGEGFEKIGDAEWTLEDAKRAGLSSKDNWRKYPRSMLFNRAMAEGARTHTPDVFGGAVYADGEIEGVVIADEEIAPPAPSDEPAVVEEVPSSPGPSEDASTAAAEPEAGVDERSASPSGDSSSSDAGTEQSQLSADDSAAPASPPSPDEIVRLQNVLEWNTGKVLKFAREKIGKHIQTPNWSALSEDDTKALVEALREEAGEE